jgi:hypothetical protein
MYKIVDLMENQRYIIFSVGLTRYLLRLRRSKLRILVKLITGHCQLNKHLHNMGLIDEPICTACEMEDELAFHLLCNCSSLISLRMRLFSNPILGVEGYEGASASALLRFALASGRFTVTTWPAHGDLISPTFNQSVQAITSDDEKDPCFAEQCK